MKYTFEYEGKEKIITSSKKLTEIKKDIEKYDYILWKNKSYETKKIQNIMEK